jgi:hypothetical protein
MDRGLRIGFHGFENLTARERTVASDVVRKESLNSSIVKSIQVVTAPRQKDFNINGSNCRQPPMTEYRACTIGEDGHFVASRVFRCDNDTDAIVWAKQLIDKRALELWSGERLVLRLAPSDNRGSAVSHQIREGRMVQNAEG